MKRCLQLATNGVGTTRPNPSVGAVIVYNNKIIGEGFTKSYGGNHAEVNAIQSVKDKSLLKKATMYVTLEPCSHFGKTPPCSDLIIEKQIPTIVIGCIDTNSLVAGKGVEKLLKAGRNVIVGVLEEECKQQHKRFFANQNKKRPYIILKWAETLDGFIAPKTKSEQKPVWISNKFSQQLVHKWRATEHAILVGTNTVIADNPSLNVRSWAGNNPIKIVLDKDLRTPLHSNIFKGATKTIVLTEAPNKSEEETIIMEQINFSQNIAKQVCDVLQKHNIQSVIVEGGTKTLQTFIDENLWDEARVFVGNTRFNDGVKKPEINTIETETKKIQSDILKIYYND